MNKSTTHRTGVSTTENLGLNDSQLSTLSPTNSKPEYGLGDLAAIKCGEVTHRQHAESPRSAGTLSTERSRELRRMLVRNKLSYRPHGCSFDAVWVGTGGVIGDGR